MPQLLKTFFHYANYGTKFGIWVFLLRGNFFFHKKKESMPIKTPDILPGEKGYVPKKERTAKKKQFEKTTKKRALKKDLTIGKIKPGKGGYRIGRPMTIPNKGRKYPIWRYSKKIGEILVKNKGLPDEEVSFSFNRLGGIGSHRHLIQDADFRLQWATREQELLITQNSCYLCSKPISRSAKPNLYHYNMFKKRTDILEKASEVPGKVISGKLTIEEGWKKFNDILEEGNRYYMSLKDTALLCSSCTKKRNLEL